MFLLLKRDDGDNDEGGGGGGRREEGGGEGVGHTVLFSVIFILSFRSTQKRVEESSRGSLNDAAVST